MAQKVSYEGLKESSKIEPGIEIVGFGNIHFELEMNVVRCLNRELQLDVEQTTEDSVKTRIKGRVVTVGRRVKIIPQASGVIVELSICKETATALLSDCDSTKKSKLAKKGWEIFETFRVINGHIEQVNPRRKF